MSEELVLQSSKVRENDACSDEQQLVSVQETEKTRKPPSFYVIIYTSALLGFMAAVDSVSTSSALPSILKSLSHKGSTQSTTAAYSTGTGYYLAQTVVIPVCGNATDVFGRKVCIMIAIVLFLVGAILCGWAKTISWLIGARVIQGFGSAGILALGPMIVADLTRLRERAKYTAIMVLSWAVGMNGGIVLGGAIGQDATWRWIFWTNIPFCVVARLLLGLFMDLQLPEASFASLTLKVDWMGIFVLATSSTLFLVGVTLGGTLAAWGSATVLCPLCLGVAGSALFIVLELRNRRNPMISMGIFVNRTASAGYVGTFFHAFSISPFCYLIPLFFLGVSGDSRLLTAVKTLIGILPGSFSAVLAGVLVSKTARLRNVIWLGWSLCVCGFGLMTMMSQASGPFVVYFPLVLASIGSGILFMPLLFAIQSVQTDEDVAIATNTEVFMRNLGLTVAVAVAAVVFENRFEQAASNLDKSKSIPGLIHVGGREAVGAWDTMQNLPEAQKDAYRGVYATALQQVWTVMAVAMGVGLIASLFARNISMDRNPSTSTQIIEGDRARKYAVAATMSIHGPPYMISRSMPKTQFAVKDFVFNQDITTNFHDKVLLLPTVVKYVLTSR